MRATPPTSHDKSRLETCPLCDAKYDPGTGHVCGDASSAEPDVADLEEAEVEPEAEGSTNLSLPQTPQKPPVVVHAAAPNQATMLETSAAELIAAALAKAAAAAPPPAGPPPAAAWAPPPAAPPRVSASPPVVSAPPRVSASQPVVSAPPRISASQPVVSAPRISASQPVVSAPRISTSQPVVSAPSAASTNGDAINERYEVIKELSRGGMGVVYKARHRILNNIVAVKVLLKPGTEIEQRRFLQEAQLASKVAHPNTVYISDFGVLPDGKSFLVMEFIEGPTLTALMRKQEKHRLDLVRACRIAAQIAQGMQTVHDKGIVHRDLKPDNIFVLDHKNAGDGSTDFVKIVDFGIAKDTSGEAQALAGQLAEMMAKQQAKLAAGALVRLPDLDDTGSRSGRYDSGNQSGTGGMSGGVSGGNSTGTSTGGLTEVGASLGTPRYMSPEQVVGKVVGPQTDQYALGCILYQMISGHTPFSADTSMALFACHMVEPPTPLRVRVPQLNVPESLDAVVLRMLAKKPEDRFASMRDAAAALDREIEVLSLKRGDKVVMSSGLAALLGGRKGTHVIIRGRKIPIVGAVAGLLGLIGLLVVGSLFAYHRFFSESTTLEPGELRALEERARQILLEDLRAQNAEMQLGAMTGLAQTRDGRYLAALEEKLSDPSAIVQAQAADALGQLGDKKAVPLLLETMKKVAFGPVQLATAQALVALGDEQGQKLLEAQLDSTSEQTRLRAASLLCERGHPKALEVLTKVLDSKRLPEDLALNLLTCLSHAGDENARQKLRTQLAKAANPEGAMVAAAKLAQLGLEDGRAFLRERLRKPGPEQLLAARFLAAPDEPQVGAIFRQILRERAAPLPPRLLAIEGLGLSGQLIDARLLGKQLDPGKEPSARLGAATSIVLLARNEPSALTDDSMRWARGALSDSKWAIREAAAGVIGDSAANDAVPLLAKLLTDSHPMVRQSAARALGRRREEQAAAALRDGLRDGEATVRQESLRSLLRLSKTFDANANKKLRDNAGVWVKETLTSGSDSEKALARSLLLRLGDRNQLDALRALAGSASDDVRQLVVENLGRELDVLLPLLKDGSFAVRFGAAKELAEAGDKRAVPVLREALERKGPESLLALSLLRKLGEKVELPAGLVNALVSGPVGQRLAAAEVAAKLPPELALLLLRPLAHDVDPSVRRLVAAAAAELPNGPDGPAGLPILRLLASDPDPSVRARAAALLVPLLPIEETAPLLAKGDKTEGPDKRSGRGGDSIMDKGAADNSPPDLGSAEAPDLAPAEGPQGNGLLVVEAAPLVEFSIDHGRWQTAPKEPIHVAAGPHQISALSGVQKIELKDKETLNVQIPESQVEKLTSSGLEAVERKDFKKAQKLLEKAIGVCSRERKFPQPCNNLSLEISFQLGQIHQSQERFAEAMNDYQQVVELAKSSKAKEERRAAAQKAMAELLPNLGQVVIPKKVKNKCQEATLYMLPGTHQIELDGQTQTVKVRAQETVRLGSCE